MPTMVYSRRILIAVIVSALIHGAVVHLWFSDDDGVLVQEETPKMVVHLRNEPLQYIETNATADTPPEETPFISREDARAASLVERNAPTEKPAPADALPDDQNIPAQAPPLSVPDASAPVKPEPPPEQKQETHTEPEPSEDATPPRRLESARATPVSPSPPESAPSSPGEGPRPAPQAPRGGPPTEARARTPGRTVTYGMSNFEALRHELGPYFEEIKKAVERQWLEALLMRYTGTSPTRAEVFCAIAPDGSLVEARITGLPGDALFAGICRDAVERAAPFSPFPFDVPDIYRNQNLEIHWHFSFL